MRVGQKAVHWAVSTAASTAANWVAQWAAQRAENSVAVLDLRLVDLMVDSMAALTVGSWELQTVGRTAANLAAERDGHWADCWVASWVAKKAARRAVRSVE
jgi:hypothetical protein